MVIYSHFSKLTANFSGYLSPPNARKYIQSWLQKMIEHNIILFLIWTVWKMAQLSN